MKHRVSTIALSVAAFGASTFFTSSFAYSQSDKSGSKMRASQEQTVDKSDAINKDKNAKESKNSKDVAASKNSNSSENNALANETASSPLGTIFTVPDGTAINSNFRPDFDGAGGRGAAMPQDEGTKKDGYYVKTRGYRIEPEPDVPIYARQANETYKELKGIDWLNVGLDSRVRFEDRANDYRPFTDDASALPYPNAKGLRMYTQSLWLERTRGYIGVKDILDPLRLVVEFQDSRAFNNIYPLQGQEINQTELIQGYGELYFKDALGKDAKGQGRPISIRAGRMAFEIGSRRLIARNEFRNTTNNFEGFRLKLGQRENDFDIDSFAMRPVIRYPYVWDQPDWQNWVYGSFVSIRPWSEYVTIQPYFIGRHAWADPTNWQNSAKVPRQTQAPGLRLYGTIGNFDYDLDLMKQFGQIGELQQYASINTAGTTPGSTYLYKTAKQDSIAYAADVGYTFNDHPWKPRISAVYIYGSGNKSPFDSVNQNVDTFYGFNQPFSRSDYISWNNVKDPKVRLEFEPYKGTQIDTAFSAYWLASSAAAWDKTGLYAPLGNRGTFMGTEWDLRIRQKVSQFWNISVSYDRFWPGSFTSSFAPPVGMQYPPTLVPNGYWPGGTSTTNGLTAKPTNFFYLEATANAFGDGKPIAKLPGSDFIASWNDHEHKEDKKPTWNDVYVGLNGGGAWSSPTMITWDTQLPGNSNDGSLVNNTAIATTTLNISPTKYTNNLSGFIGGIQIGANWNFAGNFIAGAEADLDGTAGNTNSKTSISNAIGYKNNQWTTYSQHTATLNYIGTARGRLGYLITPALQLFSTAGLAYGGVQAVNAYVVNAANAISPPQSDGYLSSAPKAFGATYQGTLAGWTAGGGAEWILTPEWSVKADYLYYNLGDISASNNYMSVMVDNPFVLSPFSKNAYNNTTITNGSTTTAHFSGNLIRAGINRHFEVKEMVKLVP